MAECCQRGDSASRRSLQIALLDEIRLNHIFNRAGLFANAGGNVVQPHRTTFKAVDHGFEQFAVHHVKAARVQFPDTGESAILKILRNFGRIQRLVVSRI